MANQKEYKIIINGIKESIEGIGTLQDSLDKLGKKVEESGSEMKTASKGMDELAKTNQKIAEYNEEYATALAANKAVLADHNKEVKAKLDLEKAEITVQEGLTDTYAHKQQLLTALGKVIKNTTGDTSELRSQYAQLNQELKDFDATMGNHQRNVGDYRGALKEAQAELKSLKGQLLNVAKGSEEWEKLTKKAGDLEDKIHDINDAIKREASDTKVLDNVINVAQSATAAFTLWKGAMSMFGIETEGAVEAIQKLQGAMAVLQSLQQLQETLKGSTATAELFSKGLKALTVSMEGASAGAKALKVALMGIGIGIIIALIAELVTHWEDLTKALGFATKEQKKFNEAIDEADKAYAKASAELEVVTAKVNAFNGSKEQEKQLVDELNSKYGSAFGHYKTLAEWKDALKKKTDAYCLSLANEAEIQALVNELTENRKQQRDLDEEIANGGSAWNKFLDDITPWSDPNAVEKSEKNKQKLEDQAKEIKAEIKSLVEENNKIAQDNELFNFAPTIEENGKKSVKATKDIAKKIAEEWVKANKQAQEEVDKANKAAIEAELKRLERLKALRKDNSKAEQDWQKQYLKLQLANAKTEEEKIEIRKKIIDLDEKIALEEKKIAAADSMKISVEELQQRLEMTEGKWAGLNEEQIQVLQTLQTQVATIKMAADEARSALGGGESSDGSTSKSGSTNPVLAWFNDERTQQFMALGQETFDVLADSISTMMDWAIEEAENALDEISELHDKAVERIEESQNKISELKSDMKDANSAELEAFKEQMADEMAMLVQREAEEKRLQKEKEKREKELEKKKKQQRKAELAAQMVEAIASTALSVAKTFSQWGWPLGAVFGAIMSALGTVQVAIIAKQMSKLADGGVLGGREHKNGGNPIPSMGVEVEKGEAVINKRSTAKYLPLLDAINAEGNGGKHTLLQSSGNVIRRYADGGVLNYQRIDDNFNQLNGTAAIANAIGSIDFHPVVSVVDINRGQRNYTEVRQLAGASN